MLLWWGVDQDFARLLFLVTSSAPILLFQQTCDEFRHYSYYLQDGMDVLEFGAAEDSYLPEHLKLNRHVGVGLSTELMERNPSITEKLFVDLNKVAPDIGVDSEDLWKLGASSFDAIIMANTIDFLTDPREVFR